MKKIAIIGANEFQNKLVLKAKEMGIETHVFAWEEGAIAKENSDFFYPMSIVEKEKILETCKEIKIDGVCSIASDLAMPTVNFIADRLGLIGNTLDCTLVTTNKYEMRKRLIANDLPCPQFNLIEKIEDLDLEKIEFPLIIKPIDRSGSRGIVKVTKKEELYEAIEIAKSVSFSKEILVEEFAEGNEYSVECISQNGEHHLLQITKKYTTGAPHFIETGHIQPSGLDEKIKNKVKEIILKSLTVLGIKNGASHSEIKIFNNEIKIIEIGARMGGDFIGSDLVKYSTGIDFLKLVLEVALNNKIEIKSSNNICKNILVRFIFNKKDIENFNLISEKYENNIKEYFMSEKLTEVSDSSSRNGYYIMEFQDKKALELIF